MNRQENPAGRPGNQGCHSDKTDSPNPTRKSVQNQLSLSLDLSGKHGPCPWCKGRDRFRVDDKDMSGSFICNQCGEGTRFEFAALLLFFDPNRDFPKILEEIARALTFFDAPLSRPRAQTMIARRITLCFDRIFCPEGVYT